MSDPSAPAAFAGTLAGTAVGAAAGTLLFDLLLWVLPVLAALVLLGLLVVVLSHAGAADPRGDLATRLAAKHARRAGRVG